MNQCAPAPSEALHSLESLIAEYIASSSALVAAGCRRNEFVYDFTKFCTAVEQWKQRHAPAAFPAVSAATAPAVAAPIVAVPTASVPLSNFACAASTSLLEATLGLPASPLPPALAAALPVPVFVTSASSTCASNSTGSDAHELVPLLLPVTATLAVPAPALISLLLDADAQCPDTNSAAAAATTTGASGAVVVVTRASLLASRSCNRKDALCTLPFAAQLFGLVRRRALASSSSTAAAAA